jgi:type I restriction enzyme R subunit
MPSSPIPSYLEERVSQIPALRILMAMGWTYLPPDEANALREHRKANVVLTGVLLPPATPSQDG